MPTLGENIPVLIDKAVDFMASTQAFRERLTDGVRSDHIPDDVPDDKKAFYLARLAWYRELYRPHSEK